MATNYPASLDDNTTLPSTPDPFVDGVTTGHLTNPPTAHGAIKNLEAKVGVGTSNAASAATGDVLQKTASGTAWQTLSGSSLAIKGAPFAVVYPGTTTEARKSSDASVISSSTNPTTVINAAIAAAGAVANGGTVQLADGLFPDLPGQIVLPSSAAGVQLLGYGGTKDRPASDNPLGTVLRPGSGFAATALIAVGGSGASGHAGGCRIAGLTLDTNANAKQIHGIFGFNAQDLIIERCVFLGPGQSVNNKRGIFLNSDQITNGGSGAEPRIHHNWFRNWDSALYAGTVNGQDGETATSVGLTDGHFNDNDSWSCRRTVILHHGGWMLSDNHLVGNTTTDFHVQTDSHITIDHDYYDSVKAGGWGVELQVGCVAGSIRNSWFICDADATTIGVRWTAQRNSCDNNSFDVATGGTFLKFTNAGNGGHITNNSGTGPTTDSDVLHTSAGATITQPAVQSGAGFYYAGNMVL